MYKTPIKSHGSCCNVLRVVEVLRSLSQVFFKLQKNKVRACSFIVNNSTIDANTGPIFKTLELLKLHDIHLFQLGFFMFLFKNSTLPSKFNSLYSLGTVKSIIIILGMPILLDCHHVKQTPDCFQFISKIQSLTIL